MTFMFRGSQTNIFASTNNPPKSVVSQLASAVKPMVVHVLSATLGTFGGG